MDIPTSQSVNPIKIGVVKFVVWWEETVPTLVSTMIRVVGGILFRRILGK